MTILSSLAALSSQFVMNRADLLRSSPVRFTKMASKSQSIVVIGSSSVISSRFGQNLVNCTISTIFKETKISPNLITFENSSYFDEWLYKNQKNSSDQIRSMIYSFVIDEDSNGYHISIYNNFSLSDSRNRLLLMNRLISQAINENPEYDISITPVSLSRHISGNYVSLMVPIFITFGVLNICMLFVGQAIEDVSSEKRPYMLSTGLSLPSYWIGCFIADYIVWIGTTSLLWMVYYLSDTPIFTNHLLESYLSLIISGPGVILLVYCVSFAFSSPETGSNYAYFFIMIPFLLLSGGSNITPNAKFNKLLGKIRMLYPVSNLFHLFNLIANNRFKYSSFSIIPYSIIICVIMLAFIEWTFYFSEKNQASLSFVSYRDEFLSHRAKHMAIGAKEHEDSVKKGDKQFIMRLIDVCRLFFSSKRKAIAAVNHATFGISKGEIFGLLGANGAGKTTLMKMISGRLSMSYGSILFENSANNIPSVALCPQFDDHLSPELTGAETLKFFSLLYKIPSIEFDQMFEKFVHKLDLQDHIHKCISEMSGGNARKVSIGVSFLSQSPILMLDEPTSSLDPVARHCIHDLIVEHKGRKTFILCTHLLGEAENLCDNIAIMIKGCIYTYGSPQLLSNHFGKDWKIDVLFQNIQSITEGEKYINENIPSPKLLFKRQRTHVYSVPCNLVSLPDLFTIMQNGIDNECGIAYFTCSSSTLEKVFMELVKMTENIDESPKDDRSLL